VVFKTTAIDRSAISPRSRLQSSHDRMILPSHVVRNKSHTSTCTVARVA